MDLDACAAQARTERLLYTLRRRLLPVRERRGCLKRIGFGVGRFHTQRSTRARSRRRDEDILLGLGWSGLVEVCFAISVSIVIIVVLVFVLSVGSKRCFGSFGTGCL